MQLEPIYLHAGELFDSKTQKWEKNKVVVVAGEKIRDVLDAVDFKEKGTHYDLRKHKVMPGLVDVHTHVFLHPYSETSWETQVLEHSDVERTARAVNHARDTLMSGFTTIRDLGTEGASHADIHLRDVIEKGIIPGPRIYTATHAITPSGAYGPKPIHSRGDSPQQYGWSKDVLPHGTMVADGVDEMRKVVRHQIGLGADVIKLYGDYRRRGNHPRAEGYSAGEKTPLWTDEEVKVAVEEAKRAGIPVAVHAKWPPAILQATRCGARSIEHGTLANAECFEEMKRRGTYWVPTLAAWQTLSMSGDPLDGDEWDLLLETFRLAIKIGVKIAVGGDTGVFRHGDNIREMQIMVDQLGMSPEQALAFGTIEGWKVCKAIDTTEESDHKFGYIGRGWLADIIAVQGDVQMDFSRTMESVDFVMKAGELYKGKEMQFS